MMFLVTMSGQKFLIGKKKEVRGIKICLELRERRKEK